MTDLFALASQKKYRFDTPQGQLSVEDLWELPLQTTRLGRASLDAIAIGLDKQIKEIGTVSFVDDAPAGSEELKAKFDIVLQIIEVRKEEKKAKETRQLNAEKKQQILAIIANKENEALSGKTIDELQQIAAAL